MGSSLEYMRKWRANNKEKTRQYACTYRRTHPEQFKATRRRLALSDYYRLRNQLIEQLGSVCRHCGLGDIRVLVIDHKDGGGEQQRKTISMMKFYRLVRDNPKPYQLLCHNCNHLKRIENNEDIREPTYE